MAELRCDVPGCGARRDRHHRLCSRCFHALGGDLGRRINMSFRHDKKQWRALCRIAGERLAFERSGRRAAPAQSPIDPVEFQRRQAAILGERD